MNDKKMQAIAEFRGYLLGHLTSAECNLKAAQDLYDRAVHGSNRSYYNALKVACRSEIQHARRTLSEFDTVCQVLLAEESES